MGCVWTLSWGSVHMELSMGQLVASLYAVHSWACVHYRWRCVSLEEKTHLGRHLVVTPTNSLVICIQLHQAGLCEIVEGGAIPANVSA